jgi:glycosyltransferase involved in cell wall biosynthesis
MNDSETFRGKVALIGNLANVAFSTAQLLRNEGCEADLFLMSTELGKDGSDPNFLVPGIVEREPWIKVIDVPGPVRVPLGQAPFNRLQIALRWRIKQISLWTQLRKYNLIHSFGAQPNWTSKIGVPYVALATGSDLRELAIEDSKQGRKVIRHFQKADLVQIASDRGHHEIAQQLGISRIRGSRLAIDTELYSPGKRRSESSTDDGSIVIFHPARLNWTKQVSGLQKQNDVLFRAIALLDSSLKERIRLIYVKRGEDIGPTDRLVRELDLTSITTAIEPPSTAAELSVLYNSSDIVVDNFGPYIGFGLITLEAMACGKPVVCEIDDDIIASEYKDPMPVLNAANPEQAAVKLADLIQDGDLRRSVGEKSRNWIIDHHSESAVFNILNEIYASVAGGDSVRQSDFS